MTSFESCNLVADLIFGLVMLVYGFAGGMFVAGWVLAKTQKSATNSTTETARSGVTRPTEI